MVRIDNPLHPNLPPAHNFGDRTGTLTRNLVLRRDARCTLRHTAKWYPYADSNSNLIVRSDVPFPLDDRDVKW